LREITNAKLSFHRLERLYIESRYVDADVLLSEMREWLHLNGTPPAELDHLNRASMSMMERCKSLSPTAPLTAGGDPMRPLRLPRDLDAGPLGRPYLPVRRPQQGAAFG